MSSSSSPEATLRPNPGEGLGGRLLAAVPGVAVAVAEGAWIAVWYAALAGAAGSAGGRPLGLLAFAGAAGLGLAVARRLHRSSQAMAPSPGRRVWSRIATAALVVGAAGLGLAAGLPGGADGGPGGFEGLLAALGRGEASGALLGLAVWRGTRHADPETDDLVTAALLRWGTPLLAVPWLVGGLRPATGFVEDALLGTLVFVAAGLVGVGLARLEALDRAVGLDWRRNRAWLVLLVAVVVGTTLIAIPAALLVGASVDALLAVVAAPAGAVVGGAERVAGALGAAVGIGSPVASGPGAGAEGGGAPTGGGLPAFALPGVVAGLAAVFFALLLVAAAYGLARRVRGGRPSPEPPVTVLEERRIRLPRPALRLARPTLGFELGRRRPPRTATEAYLGLVERLGSASPAGRLPSESPSAHAHRVRTQGSGSFRLDLLAADVVLERFAGRRLPDREVRRAVERARRPRLGSDGGAR
jgi:hypothetical protein